MLEIQIHYHWPKCSKIPFSKVEVMLIFCLSPIFVRITESYRLDNRDLFNSCCWKPRRIMEHLLGFWWGPALRMMYVEKHYMERQNWHVRLLSLSLCFLQCHYAINESYYSPKDSTYKWHLHRLWRLKILILEILNESFKYIALLLASIIYHVKYLIFSQTNDQKKKKSTPFSSHKKSTLWES